MTASRTLRRPWSPAVAAAGLLWMLLASCASQGRNLVAEGRTELLAANRLRAGVVRLVEPEDAPGTFDIDARSFADSGRLLAYLSVQPRSRFADGLLVDFVEKEAVARDLYQGVVGFCVRNDLDLFASTRVSKAGSAEDLVWVVQSTVSPYLSTP